MKKHFKTIMSIIILLLTTTVSTAASQSMFSEEYAMELVLGLTAIVCFMMVILLFTVFYVFNTVLNDMKPELETEQETSWIKRFIDSMTRAVPVSQENTIMTDHAYDGIRELDNRLPPWWLYGFYFSIFFGALYVAYYHVFKLGPLQEEEYVIEVIKAEEDVKIYLASLENSIDETNVELTLSDNDLSAAKTLYAQNCIACHGMEGQGGVGPNLTDPYWLHGGDVKNVFKTIKYGVPAKGMIAWKNKFSPKQMQQLSSYLISLEGSNPENPKAPQGELYERTSESKTDSETEPQEAI